VLNNTLNDTECKIYCIIYLYTKTVDFCMRVGIILPMSIKIRFEQGPTVMHTALKDEALGPLMAIIQKYVLAEAEALPAEQYPIDQQRQPPPQMSLFPEKRAKDWLAKHGAAEVLNKLGWDTFPEKILALGAFHEAKAGDDFDSWRSADILARFADAKEAPPTNFPRDIAATIKTGWVGPKTPRTYIVSRTGWILLSNAITKLPPE
jgi:hypothetical protein